MDNKLHNLASYLESLSSIVQEVDIVMETQAGSLEALLVLMLENIPNIHPSKHFLCRRALLALLLSLMPKWTTFSQVLSGFGKCNLVLLSTKSVQWQCFITFMAFENAWEDGPTHLLMLVFS